MQTNLSDSQVDIRVFAEKIDLLLEKEIEIFFSTIPYAKHLTASAEPLHEKYYLRHRIETIKRIKLTAKTDALALAAMIDENYDMARKWGKYTVQEMNHDMMFLTDLKTHGLTELDVSHLSPFKATENLINYLINAIKQHGSLPAVLYSLFVEWNSDRYSKNAVDKAKEYFSEKHVKGSDAHVKFDETHDHYHLILEIAYKLNKENEKTFFILRDISALFRDYFQELYDHTIANDGQ